MKWHLIGVVVLITSILSLMFVSALPTIFNPFTGKLDYYGADNSTNLTMNNLNVSRITFVPTNFSSYVYNNGTTLIIQGNTSRIEIW